VEEHFMVMDDGVAVQSSVFRCLSELLCPELAFSGHFNKKEHHEKSQSLTQDLNSTFEQWI
jgi:hypothetical protein